MMEILRLNQGAQSAQSAQSTQSTYDKISMVTDSVTDSNINTFSIGTNTNDSSRNDNPIDEKELKKAVDKLNKFMEDDNISIEYAVHPYFKDTMIKITEKSTGNIIIEVPPKQILDMVAKMCELAGMIFDKKA